MNRLFWIVLDSLGIGEAPDAADFGDTGSNTLKSISKSKKFHIPNLLSLGMGNIDSLSYLGAAANPRAAHARLTESSRGKDTTIGHWEMAGIISPRPLPTFPDGFPPEIISQIETATGRKVICNKPYSGTEVIRDYGDLHIKTGSLIVYTSADSVFQIAAHEEIVPVDVLYKYCEAARKILTGEYAVGRVIARPFTGKSPDFIRTSRRHDFSLEPYGNTVLDDLKAGGLRTISVGKIYDIFAGRSIDESHPAVNNSDAMNTVSQIAERDFRGLCFVNLVDFDMLYGHRNDTDGYAAAVSEFDRWLGGFLQKMRSDDVLFITADHGCDPATPSTDHSREYVPFLAYGSEITPVNLGTRASFADIAATAAELFCVKYTASGTGFAPEIKKELL